MRRPPCLTTHQEMNSCWRSIRSLRDHGKTHHPDHTQTERIKKIADRWRYLPGRLIDILNVSLRQYPAMANLMVA